MQSSSFPLITLTKKRRKVKGQAVISRHSGTGFIAEDFARIAEETIKKLPPESKKILAEIEDEKLANLDPSTRGAIIAGGKRVVTQKLQKFLKNQQKR